MKTSDTAGISATRIAQLPAHGDYLCSESDLYCVEQVGPRWLVLEDCRTGKLLDISIAEAADLRHVNVP